MKLRSGLFAGSIVAAIIGTVADGSAGLLSPSACVTPATLIALTALPTDAIGTIAQERLNLKDSNA